MFYFLFELNESILLAIQSGIFQSTTNVAGSAPPCHSSGLANEKENMIV